VDQFELVVEHAAADQHVHLTGFYPVQEFHHQIRDILRQSAKMQDMPLTVHHTHRPGAEHAGLLHQASGHDAMSSQQIVYRIGIEFLQPLINLVGILDLCNILWRSQNLFAVQNCCHLLQGKGILLDGQGTMDGADAVCSPQGGVRGQLLGRSQPTNQLCNLNNIIDNSICNFKRRFFVPHIPPLIKTLLWYFTIRSLISPIII
jgi:hypothetical protein